METVGVAIVESANAKIGLIMGIGSIDIEVDIPKISRTGIDRKAAFSTFRCFEAAPRHVSTRGHIRIGKYKFHHRIRGVNSITSDIPRNLPQIQCGFDSADNIRGGAAGRSGDKRNIEDAIIGDSYLRDRHQHGFEPAAAANVTLRVKFGADVNWVVARIRFQPV